MTDYYKVLIADDQRIIREGMANMIDWRAFGYEVCGFASNGIQALEMLRNGDYDLLITDIRMPEMDGIELARRGRELKHRPEVFIISGYREFEYAQAAIEYGVRVYLLKPLSAEKLTEALLILRADLEAAAKRRSREFERVLLNMLSMPQNDAWQIRQLRSAGISLEHSFYNISVICLTEYENSFNVMFGDGEDGESLKELTERFLNRYVVSYIAQAQENRLVVLFCLDDGDISRVKLILAELFAYLSGFMPLRAGAAVGNIAGAPAGIFASYRSAQRIIASGHLLQKENSVIADEQELLASADRSGGVIPDCSMLVNCVCELRTTDIERSIDDFLGQCAGMGASLSTAHIAAVQPVLRLTEYLSEHGGDVSALTDGENWFESIFHAVTLDELKRCLTGFCELCVCRIETTERSDGSFNIDAVIRYIDKNCEQDINIKTLAGMFFVSPAYLGKLFTRRMGQNLNAYLNECRIKRAKQLLRGSNRKIYDVCTMVGYSSLKYFYKIFKSVTGMTPSEYRMTCQNRKG